MEMEGLEIWLGVERTIDNLKEKLETKRRKKKKGVEAEKRAKHTRSCRAGLK